jgi:GNAT superfamily N-acetyltransferase
MADIDGLRQRHLGSADVPAALALSEAAGWNQTGADWALFIEHGRTIGLFTPDGTLVATAAALPYEGGFGWISMVIVADAWRRRGLARRLMNVCIETLRGQGRAALLDATPAGAEVYSRIGFTTLSATERWEGAGGSPAATGMARGAPVRRLAASDTERLVAADAVAFGAPRRFLLADFLARPGTVALALDDSYVMVRHGQRATQLGPLIAGSAGAARALLAAAIASSPGLIFLDLLERWSDLAALLLDCGFRRQRPFRRMVLGRADLPGDPTRLAIAAGPEFG